MKKFFTIFVVLLLLLIGIYFLGFNGESKAIDPKPKYKTVDVAQGDLTVKISATGVVEPNFQVEVKSKASGEILKFPYEEGDFVKKGTLLLQLDKSDEARNVVKAEANLQSAQSQLKKARIILLLQETRYATDLRAARSAVEAAEANLQEAQDKLRRQVDLFEKKITSREARDEAKTAYKVNQEMLVQAQARLQAALDARHDITLRENEIELAEVEVKRVQIALDEARERLDETEIFSPIAGVIIKKQVEKGQIISSGISNVSGGTALCMIADMSRLFIIADVDETDIGSIKRGQEVSITADAFPEETFRGTVKRIAPQGEIENNITIFKVKIEILGSGKNNLKPMMTANIDIVSRREKNTLYVPREAVNKDKGQLFVVSLEGNQPKKIPVTKGIQNEIHAQILSGVHKGQKLVVGDWEKIQAEENKSKNKKNTLRRILWMLRAK